jgi:hypothetical protein
MALTTLNFVGMLDGISNHNLVSFLVFCLLKFIMISFLHCILAAPDLLTESDANTNAERKQPTKKPRNNSCDD